MQTRTAEQTFYVLQLITWFVFLACQVRMLRKLSPESRKMARTRKDREPSPKGTNTAAVTSFDSSLNIDLIIFLQFYFQDFGT